MKYKNIREEELKTRVAQDYFAAFDYAKIIGNIDFALTIPNENSLLETQSLLWAEAKKGSSDIFTSIVQLILTIGKAKTFNDVLPPPFLGAFDAEKIAFIPYNSIYEVFYQNDFNWNVAPSNYETKEFKQVFNTVQETIKEKSLIFFFEKDDIELEEFIEDNFIEGKIGLSKIKIDKNNFISIFNKWVQTVKPTIAVNWDLAKKTGIISGDFYLADLLSSENNTLKENLFVWLKKDHYLLDRKIDAVGFFTSKRSEFMDKQKAHKEFWNKYERPPKEQYWNYIVERRDLLVPQDIRERKGSFFTPQIWVELSQKYLADVLGENWQEEYYIWDCASGTGNLLAGLANKYNIWASTLDQQDVDVMKDRIQNGANLLESHVFQFDFLNDSFDKLPNSLKEIINNPEERKKLIIYINPPYAEIAGKKHGVNINKIHDKYAQQLKVANRELFAQFLIRIYNEIQDCKIAEFSKLKALTGSNFSTFRSHFLAKLEKCFVMPANTFDNVSGKFPIGFKIWDTNIKEEFVKIKSDVYDKFGKKSGKYNFYALKNSKYFSKWVNSFKLKEGFYLAWLEGVTRNDFQSQQGIIFLNQREQIAVPRGIAVYDKNLMKSSVCFAVRKVIPANWLNDRDQFLFPKKKWEKDIEFQNDCFTYTLFNNNIQSKYGINHWIPFTETEVNAKDKFSSNFMTKFITGEIKIEGNGTLLDTEKSRSNALIFSPEAQEVFDAGRELWKYYHSQPNLNVNASLYDIRERFQGRNAKGRMNPSSNDKTYTKLIDDLRDKLKVLAKKIEPKVYEYGFLKK